MMICKIPQQTVIAMFQTLDQISISPGIDNADMYVGLGMMLKDAINHAVEEQTEEGVNNG